MNVRFQHVRHFAKDLRPTLGQADQSIPHPEDHEYHLKAVFKASPRGFSFGIERSRRVS